MMTKMMMIDNNDDKDDDDVNSKDVEVVEISTGEALKILNKFASLR